MPSPYTILRTLHADQSWLAQVESGRKVVLKILPDDCQIGKKLHPNIAERLQKLREIPMIHYAHLISVDRVDGKAMVVTQYIEGIPITQAPADEYPRLLRELSVAVQSLHQFGLVHGQIHANNVIVDPHGTLYLIDASPYLYDNPQVDFDGIQALAAEIGLADEKSIDEQAAIRKKQEDHQFHLQGALTAGAVLLLAVLLGVGLIWWLSKG